jgi:hypothetical protein
MTSFLNGKVLKDHTVVNNGVNCEHIYNGFHIVLDGVEPARRGLSSCDPIKRAASAAR